MGDTVAGPVRDPRRSRLVPLALGAVVAVGGVLASAGAASAAIVDPAKVAICHVGNGSRNMVDIEPSVNGVINGHMGHAGDIIPPFTYNGVDYPGQNWDAQGQAIYDADCDPNAQVAPIPDPSTDNPTDPAGDPTDPATTPAGDPTDPATTPAGDPTDPPTSSAPAGDPTDPSTGSPSATVSPVSVVLAAGDAPAVVAPAVPAVAPAAVSGAVLADTGSNPGPLLVAAGVALAFGALLVGAARRHRWRHSA